MIEVKFRGAQATIDGMTHVVKITPGRAAGAMNAAVDWARKETIKDLMRTTAIPRRILAGTSTLGRGGHIKRTKAKARRPIARLVALVAGVRLARVGLRHAGKSPMNMPPSVIPRLFTARMGSSHHGVYARHPLPSTRVSVSRSAGTRRANLPINEAVIQLFPQARRAMQLYMDKASRIVYPRELWRRLEKAVRQKATRAGQR